MKIYKVFAKFTFMMLFAGFTFAAKAQQSTLGAVFYQNQYLANPSLAGRYEGLNASLSYRQQWSRIEGAPVNQALTVDWSGGKRVGLGLLIYSDQAGLLNRTRTMATYAYHLPLGENQQLHFGISFGFMSQRIKYEDVIGDLKDNSLERFDNRQVFLDGDFGLAFTTSKLNLQLAVPNLRVMFNNEENIARLDRTTFFTAISYKIPFENFLNGMKVEPKIVYQGVKDFDDLLNIGANVTFSDEKLSVMTIWSSSDNLTYGIGINHNRIFSFTGMYGNSFKEIQGFDNAYFELGVKCKIF